MDSMDLFFKASLIILLLVAFGFYTAAMWISYKTGSRYAFQAPLPPLGKENDDGKCN
jgi:hypothetical protein